jgi:hypothetical protein
MIRSDWEDLTKARQRQQRAKGKAMSLPTSLKAELENVCELAPPPSDDPIYDYLTGVYRLRCKVASSAELQNALKAHHKAHSPKTLQEYAGVIIQLTAGDHVGSNMKYKYVAALEYAFADNVKPQNLKSFIKQHGGLNKCVELWRKKQRRGKSQKKPRKKRP